MEIFSYHESHWDEMKNGFVDCADWSVCYPLLHNDHIIVTKKSTGDSHGKIRCFKVQENDEFVYKLMKTKIKAQGGARGLVKFLQRCKESQSMDVLVLKILNYAWNEMKYTYL